MEHISESDLLNNLMTLIPAGIFWKDTDRRFLGANQMFLDYYNLKSVDEIIGKTDEDMGWHIDPVPFRNVELRVIGNGESVLNVPGQCIVQGRVRNIKASKCPLFSDGKIVGLIGYFLDVTDAVQEQTRLSALSQTDELTGVLNRRAYTEIALQYEEQYKQNHTDFVLYMIDLDDFKTVNDDYGHEYGNLVLQSICKSLTVAASDNCVLFRYGGDEFVILHQLQSEDEIELLQKRFIRAVDSPRNLDGAKFSVKASIGHALYSETTSLLSLIELADKRMYEMKKQHKASR
ncbi:sensor domain-containing diguanylate cyclase [Butyrivibrio sp.]|jgi:diguanylate cyclase (GGDEF)-like protein|uniref:sensor domain-containing diguanylate cyclase n=1 Tax=Butyrivibrio sp. TaxID=28121 RepID=UPI0025B7DD15|nr:sensor domain-containing diguanylate cyclase [Butyrivibrio sp.]MBE5836474.1 GGDEF domain-containing protein [Butyrivibrio sp.]